MGNSLFVSLSDSLHSIFCRDAGIVLASYLSDMVSQPKAPSPLFEIMRGSRNHVSRVIELGSGCGIVGLEVTRECVGMDILLTDLPEAMGILNQNVGEARSASQCGEVATKVLDWNYALPDEVFRARYDVIIVSDCTYNSDSIPALVKTMAALVEKSVDALIVVSMKIRHDSEAIFFDLMAAARFTERDHVRISLPDRQRQETGQSLEIVDIFTYAPNIQVEKG